MPEKIINFYPNNLFKAKQIIKAILSCPNLKSQFWYSLHKQQYGITSHEYFFFCQKKKGKKCPFFFFFLQSWLFVSSDLSTWNFLQVQLFFLLFILLVSSVLFLFVCFFFLITVSIVWYLLWTNASNWTIKIP